ncbi:MAG: hypothetical protein M1817_001913 [Caeruleum heppii]|nr:MAG: hypothetical protein M1817_001913 [Caeruleum heppii]
MDAGETVLSQPAGTSTSRNGTTKLNSFDRPPSFLLLVPASQTNPNLCKTLLSAFILDYPTPTLINFNKSFNEGGWDNGTHIGKIRGVLEYLSHSSGTRDDDVVLVVDGYDVWFQLPPELMLSRFHRALREANARSVKQFGTEKLDTLHHSSADKQPKFSEKVIFAADKLCWPNPIADPACQSVPSSTLPTNAWGPETDRDPGGWLNRPRFLNSGTVMGSLADLRTIYQRATHKVEEHNRGFLGDQAVFAEIFGEQEYQRHLVSEVERPLSSLHWTQLFANHLASPGPGKTEEKMVSNDMTAEPGDRYEYGLSLDYEMSLFQTMTHSDGDIEFLHFANASLLPQVLESHRIHSGRPLKVPPDLVETRLPFATFEDTATRWQVPFGPDLPSNSTWADVALGTNLHVPSVPALLHFNGDKSYLDKWWPKMWYHVFGRVLLHRHVRAPRKSRWDRRGGAGGAWTDRGQWLSWTELCGGFEDEIFGDGLGRWSKETGDGKAFDAWGKLMSDPDNGV